MPVIATIEELGAIYGQPNEASTVKVATRITPRYRVLFYSRLARRITGPPALLFSLGIPPPQRTLLAFT